MRWRTRLAGETVVGAPTEGRQRGRRRRIGTDEIEFERRLATGKNEVCGVDFVQERTADVRLLLMLVVLDGYTRECLRIEAQRNFGGEDIVAFLDELTAIRGALAHLRSGIGPEFISAAVKRWCEKSGTGTLSIDPASPWRNGIVGSFNGRLRDELLSSEIFDALAKARYLVERWLLDHNHRRIQRALAGCPLRPARDARRNLRSGSLRTPSNST